MINATVCLPWRATPDRIPAHDRCVKFWADNGFPVIEADSDSARKFVCNEARNNAVRQATTDVVIIADADTLPDKIELIHSAIAEAADGTDKVVWPFTVYRFVAGDWALRPDHPSTAPLVAEYFNSPAGIIVTARSTYWKLGGYDESFVPGAWGFDDTAFAFCAETLATPMRLEGVVWSFDHSVDSSGVPGRDLSDANPNKARYLLYEFARHKPNVMRELVKARPSSDARTTSSWIDERIKRVVAEQLSTQGKPNANAIAATTRPSLDELGVKYGCSKSSDGWIWGMDYLRLYEPLLEPLRDEPITLLELGWGEWDPVRQDHANPDNGGRSARVWREYFTRANIHIVELEYKNNTVDGVTLHHGSQVDQAFLTEVHRQAGDFDIIVDDASHISSLTIASFELLWPWLKPGGYYIIEDLHTSYHSWYYGDEEADPNPKTIRNTAMNFLKSLADEVNYRGEKTWGPICDGSGTEWDCFNRKYFKGHWIDWIKFTYQLCIIKKRA